MSYYKCSKCGTKFTPSGHLRSFTLKQLSTLFSGLGEDRVKCIEAREIVPVRSRPQNRLVARLNPTKFGYWSNDAQAVCPNCSYSGEVARLPLALRLCRFALCLVNVALNPRKIPRATWLFALYLVERVKEGPLSRTCPSFASSFACATEGDRKSA